MGPMVRGEQDQGVLIDAQLAQLVGDGSHISIHAGDHRGLSLLVLGPGLVRVDPKFWNLELGMGDAVGQIQKEGALLVLFDESNCFSGQQVVGIGLFIQLDPLIVTPKMVRVVVVSVALIVIAKELIKALLDRIA